MLAGHVPVQQLGITSINLKSAAQVCLDAQRFIQPTFSAAQSNLTQRASALS